MTTTPTASAREVAQGRLDAGEVADVDGEPIQPIRNVVRAVPGAGDKRAGSTTVGSSSTRRAPAWRA